LSNRCLPVSYISPPPSLQYRAALDARERALLEELAQHRKAKSFPLEQQRNLLAVHRTCLESAADRAGQLAALAPGGPGDLCVAQAYAELRAGVASLQRSPVPLLPQEDAGLRFEAGDVLALAAPAVTGRTRSHAAVHAPSCTASGAGLERAAVGRPAELVVRAHNLRGEALREGGAQVTVGVRPAFDAAAAAAARGDDEKRDVDGREQKEVAARVQVRDAGDGTYAVSYVVEAGRDRPAAAACAVEVRVNGVAVAGSPFRVRLQQGVDVAAPVYARSIGSELGQRQRAA
jgi:hypothetical protein